MITATDSKQVEHENVGERHGLALPIELEEGAPPHLSRAVLAVLSSAIILLLIWANIARVRELSVAVGEIAPTEMTREIAHLEGGIVEEIYVRPGDEIASGAPIVKLQPEGAGGEYDRYAVRQAILKMKAERLLAQAESRTPDFAALGKEWPSLAAEQAAIYEAVVEQHRASISVLEAREASATSEVENAKTQYESESELSEYAKEQLAIQEELINDGFTSKQAYLEAKAALSSAKANAAAAKVRLEQAKRALTAATSERESAQAEFKIQSSEERAEAIGELTELAEPIVALKDRAERLTIRAPIAGAVKALNVNGPGDVIRPGGLVAEITPVDDTLFAEVRVNPKDIGHISVGQKTDVTITTFDPNRYGKVEGRIEHISSGTFTDERDGEAYYIAYVALDRQDIGKGRLTRNLSPGMEVSAEIITQSRTLMQYLLKPVARSLDHAFSER